jgi:hypothetical protein
MKHISKIFLIAFLFYAPINLFAQDNFVLTCPLDNSLGREPKEPYTWKPEDLKVIMMSRSDSIARSCINGTVSNVATAEDGTYEVVIYYKNYYFWYVGVTKPLVKKGDKVTSKQAIAGYRPGTELEFRMFKDETPVDPRQMLECKILKATD